METIPIKKDVESKPLICTNVDSLLSLSSKLSGIRLSQEKDQLEIKINHIENKLDELFYKLYGLTEEEIRIVEGEAG